MRNTQNSIILYEDKDLMVIHKPAGIATETAKLGQADVVSELKNYRNQKGESTYLGVVHRLDQPVEGLLVFAKTSSVAAALAAQLQKGTLKKAYHALVLAGDATEGELVDYLKKDTKSNLSAVTNQQEQGAKEAKLKWKLLDTFSTEMASYALVEIEIATGRHHQIRVQMSHAGMPLLGDSKYGTEVSKALTAQLGLRQTALLANRLVFTHPTTKEKMSFSLPYPEGWKILVK